METPEEQPGIIKLSVGKNETEFHEVSPDQLEKYLYECKEQKGKQVHKNEYYQVAIIAKVDMSTTEVELDRLLSNDVRTLLIQTKCNKPQDIEMIFLKINTAIDKFYMENSFRMPIGVAVEINGEHLTTGRMRNENRVYLEVGHVIVLTTNEDYRYCCYKEIVYVSNLARYLEVMKLDDVVIFDRGYIVTKVVKCGSLRPLTVEVTRGGYLSSYMDVQVPYYIEQGCLSMCEIAEVETAVRNGAHFLMITNLKSPAYLHTLKLHLEDSIRVIGSIDFEYVEKKFLDIVDYLVNLEAVWFENVFLTRMQRQTMNAISQCHSFAKATVANIPLETCKDFKKLENHNRLKEVDCMLIEKSSIRKKFPLIAKKLLPVLGKKINLPSLENLSCGEGIVNFVIRTISSIHCKGIVVSNNCTMAALAFAIPKIYCPVICVVQDDFTARLLNLRRNLKTVVSKISMSTDYGVDFARQQGIFKTGDFIITISECMNEESEVCIDLRAYYLLPFSTSDSSENNLE